MITKIYVLCTECWNRLFICERVFIVAESWPEIKLDSTVSRDDREKEIAENRGPSGRGYSKAAGGARIDTAGDQQLHCPGVQYPQLRDQAARSTRSQAWRDLWHSSAYEGVTCQIRKPLS